MKKRFQYFIKSQSVRVKKKKRFKCLNLSKQLLDFDKKIFPDYLQNQNQLIQNRKQLLEIQERKLKLKNMKNLKKIS